MRMMIRRKKSEEQRGCKVEVEDSTRVLDVVRFHNGVINAVPLPAILSIRSNIIPLVLPAVLSLLPSLRCACRTSPARKRSCSASISSAILYVPHAVPRSPSALLRIVAASTWIRCWTADAVKVGRRL